MDMVGGMDGVLFGGRGFGTTMDALISYLSSEYGNTFALARVFAFLSGPPDYGAGQLDTRWCGEANQMVESFTSYIERKKKIVVGAASISMEKERGKIHEKVTVGSGIMQCRNHRISRPMESSISGMVDRKVECSTAGMEKEIFDHKNVVSYSIEPTFESRELGEEFVGAATFAASPQSHLQQPVLGLAGLSFITTTFLPFLGKVHIL